MEEEVSLDISTRPRLESDYMSRLIPCTALSVQNLCVSCLHSASYQISNAITQYRYLDWNIGTHSSWRGLGEASFNPLALIIANKEDKHPEFMIDLVIAMSLQALARDVAVAHII